MFRSLAVYCGSSPGKDPVFRESAYAFGQLLAGMGTVLVYGGGSVGLMGAVADGALSRGGRVIGVIPGLLNHRELAHPGVTEMHVVETMHERKVLMVQLSEAFVALPGGYGTLDELCEVLTWSQLGIQRHPVGLLDVDGYFAPFLTLLDSMVARGFMRQHDRNRLLQHTEPEPLLEAMSRWKAPPRLKWEELTQPEESPE